MAKKDKQRARATQQGAQMASEAEMIRMISSGMMPDEQTVVGETPATGAAVPITAQEYEEPTEATPRGPTRGIAGTEVITDTSGNEILVYKTGPGQAKVPVVPGTPAPVGGITKSTATGAPVTTYTASDGTTFTDRDIYLEYEASLRGQRERRQSAWDLLFEEFSRYGLGSLVQDIRGLITDSTVSPSEFAIRLRQTDAYKNRFAANPARLLKGLRALNEAEYLELEDSYQDIMRRYGLPETYYTKGELGRQQGFEDLIGFDVSPRELEERIATAQERVKSAPPEVLESIKSYYGDTIRDGDVLAYVLDPKNAVDAIKRKVAAAEIGAGARQAGLGLGRERAEELGAFGVTGEQARAGFQQIAGGVQRGSQLAAIYQEEPYGQQTAEQEIFGLAGAPQARRQRQRIIRSEEAAFGGQTGLTGGALARERAGQI
jgi:hypothetical protein